MQGKMDDITGKVWTYMAIKGDGYTTLSGMVSFFLCDKYSIMDISMALEFWINSGEVEVYDGPLGEMYRIKDCTCQCLEQEPAQSVTTQPILQSLGVRKSGTTSATSNGSGHSGSKQMRKVRKPLKKSSKKLRSTKGKSRE